MDRYSFGSIQIEVEVDEETETIATFSQIKKRYNWLRKKQKECLYALYLNNDNKVIGDKLISLGRSMETSVDLKDITRTAVLTGAEAVILVHNHPSGNCEPTESDLSATQEVRSCLERFDVQLLDHVIISRKDFHSMNQKDEI